MLCSIVDSWLCAFISIFCTFFCNFKLLRKFSVYPLNFRVLHTFLPYWKHLQLRSQNYGLENSLTPWNYFYTISWNWVIYSFIFMKSTIPRTYDCDSRHLILTLSWLTVVNMNSTTNQSSYPFSWFAFFHRVLLSTGFYSYQHVTWVGTWFPIHALWHLIFREFQGSFYSHFNNIFLQMNQI